MLYYSLLVADQFLLRLAVSPTRLFILESGDRVLGGLFTGKYIKQASINSAQSTGLGITIIEKDPNRVFEDPLNTLVDIGQPGLLIEVQEPITSIELIKLNPREIDIDSGRLYLGRDLRDILRDSNLVTHFLLFLVQVKLVYYLFLRRSRKGDRANQCTRLGSSRGIAQSISVQRYIYRFLLQNRIRQHYYEILNGLPLREQSLEIALVLGYRSLSRYLLLILLIIILSNTISVSYTVAALVEIVEIVRYGRQPINLINSVGRVHHVVRG